MSTSVSGELIIGVVGPVGTDLEKIQRALGTALRERAYRCIPYRLSEWFESGLPFPQINLSSEYLRIQSAMDAGDWIRGESKRADIMAIHAASRIAVTREQGDAGDSRIVHFLRSLKRPEEVEYLRWLYGQRFILISGYVSRARRVAHLKAKMSEEQAVELVVRDENAGSTYGQATDKTFHLADLFVDADVGVTELALEIGRFIDLALGSPLVTPRLSEHAMFLAYAASLGSGDLSRQVGAVITTDDGTLVAEGANDAPRFGGGRHWPGMGDRRDIALGHDSNAKIIAEMVNWILTALNPDAPWGVEERNKLANMLAPSGILDLTEFGRAVHAEMDALTTCARLGVSAKDNIMYCTTYPCHNCVKHLVAAGIQKVWFIEPYPKSRAMDLHSDAVSDGGEIGKMQLKPFVGIGPRRYVEWFSLSDPHGARVRRKDKAGNIVDWSAQSAWPPLPDRRMNHLDLEANAAAEVEIIIRRAQQRSHSDGIDGP